MIPAILNIRLHQFTRIAKELGIYRGIFVSLALGLLLIIAYNLLLVPENTSIATVVIALFLLAIHASRKDKKFLKIITKNIFQVYSLEYLVLVSPIIILWIINSNWVGTSSLIFICLLLPMVSMNVGLQSSYSFFKFLANPFSSNLNFKINVKLDFIPVHAFEWISGIRRNLLVLLPLYLLFLVFSFKPYVAPVGLILLSIIISGFYFEGESREFIELTAKNPQQFIVRKLWVNFKLISIFFSPIISLNLIFQPGIWYYLAGAFVFSYIIQVYSIVFKYGLFLENSNLNRNSMIVFINIICIAVPFLWPLPAVMGIKYYKKALRNLKKYFYA